MLAQVDIPGHGQALAGLDWLAITDMDGRRNEIKQFGRGVEAAWEFVWVAKDKNSDEGNDYVAFLNKSESKKRPVAAGALVRAAIPETSYIALLDVGEERFWVFAVKNGMPGRGMDLVGEASEVNAAFLGFVNTLENPTEMPVYTNKPDVLPSLSYQMDIRPFSLEILSHSINKGDYSKASFSRHTSAPVFQILICLGLIAACGGYYLYQLQADEAARRDAAQIREKAIALRKQELASAVSTAINSTLPARIAIPAYLEATQDLKRSLKGWKLTDIECQGQGCTLTFQAQAFATWDGYLKAKPQEWPTPYFDSDIGKVVQPIEVRLTDQPLRVAEGLPKRDLVRFELGNLAQISKTIGLNLTLPTTWSRVAGNQAAGSPDEQWIPMVGAFTATGSSVLINDLARRLPDTSDVSSVSFKLDETVTFELKGKAYANP